MEVESGEEVLVDLGESLEKPYMEKPVLVSGVNSSRNRHACLVPVR